MKKIFLLLLIVVVLVLRFVSVTVTAEPLPERKIECLENPDNALSIPYCDDLKTIGAEYQKSIEPIFASKCLMCHGQAKELPLYTVVPPMKWRIDHNIEEAREDLDMRYGYPFRAKGASKKFRNDLAEIKEVIAKNSMPPLDYLIMHWDSRLTEAEKQLIKDWATRSRELLKKN